ncbi:MAG TPA: hypothetical protein VK008_00730 [Sphingobacteriaceae bacterium]|nr:hypothetical protein [Sphingobacteriaceae bacterium]
MGRPGRVLVLVLLCLLLAACGTQGGPGTPADDNGNDNGDPADLAADEAVVREVVESFGSRLQQVSLLAPEDDVAEAMEEHYGPYVTEELLAFWQADPSSAPGREVSSPWPDRIEIDSVQRLGEDSYRVEGRIIEVTSEEQGTDEAAAVRPISLLVGRYDGDWLIESVTLGEVEPVDEGKADAAAGGEAEAVIYRNDTYGFRLTLPSTWEGFTVVEEDWEGRDLADPSQDGAEPGEVVERGPLLRIRHPLWTEDRIRQDIPIMVFTVSQWEAVEEAAVSVGAAPIGPMELGRNERYVFALPARYNFEFPEGYEEVEQILASDPLEPLPVEAQ